MRAHWLRLHGSSAMPPGLARAIELDVSEVRMLLRAAVDLEVDAWSELVAAVNLEVDARCELVAAVDLQVDARCELVVV
ncbi:hypothetical protein M885DRAFT_624569 [Pelagophyceae sp. CCMP2097]|nr:hypothetical protein M885DRAFT_624569 [Pelagophyceae sp. CCMP2097]